MKYFLSLLSTVGLAVLLSCQPLFAEGLSNPLPLDAHFSDQYTDDLSGLLKRRYIRVLTTMNKTNFFLSGGKPHGFEYALLKEYEKELNRKIKKKELRVVLEFIPVSRGRLIPALLKGHGDIAAAGLTITPERTAKVAFTDPYLTEIDEIVVTHKHSFSPKSLSNLSGRHLFVRKSSSYYTSLLSFNKKLLKSDNAPIEIVKADEELETEDILELVNSGAIEMTVCDSHIAKLWSGIFKDMVIHDHLKVRTGAKIAWMVRKKNPELRQSLNRFIKGHRKGTLLGNIYFKRYYRKNPWIKNPLSKNERIKLEKYKKLFQKYAAMYDLDWLLVMAMAYQESGLNNKKKNPSGAVGIMQVLPRTGKDKHVNIEDVHSLENNIHAGVKYLAFLRDRYFRDERIRPRDQVRFALASYNAGPAKIRRARSLAKEMGFDPNRWFRNVELAALKLIGQETAQYVSNINKYYVIYRLALENVEIRQKEKKEMLKKGNS